MRRKRDRNFGIRWLRDLLCGVLIGAGAILPGVSGGVLAVVFDIYRPFMEVLTHPRAAIPKYWRWFLPIGLGCAIGFVGGSYIFPKILWHAYNIMYGFGIPIEFVLDGKLAAISVATYLLCALGATYLVCRGFLREVPAELIRPKAPKEGKRVLLERITFLWKRLGFLTKVSLRNVLRYKQRFFMMVLGIGGCTALLLTGFGIKDSIANVVDYQFEEITLYDAAVSFTEEMDAQTQQAFSRQAADIFSACTKSRVLSAESSPAGSRKERHWSSGARKNSSGVLKRSKIRLQERLPGVSPKESQIQKSFRFITPPPRRPASFPTSKGWRLRRRSGTPPGPASEW